MVIGDRCCSDDGPVKIRRFGTHFYRRFTDQTYFCALGGIREKRLQA